MDFSCLIHNRIELVHFEVLRYGKSSFLSLVVKLTRIELLSTCIGRLVGFLSPSIWLKSGEFEKLTSNLTRYFTFKEGVLLKLVI